MNLERESPNFNFGAIPEEWGMQMLQNEALTACFYFWVKQNMALGSKSSRLHKQKGRTASNQKQLQRKKHRFGFQFYNEAPFRKKITISTKKATISAKKQPPTKPYVARRKVASNTKKPFLGEGKKPTSSEKCNVFSWARPVYQSMLDAEVEDNSEAILKTLEQCSAKFIPSPKRSLETSNKKIFSQHIVPFNFFLSR